MTVGGSDVQNNINLHKKKSPTLKVIFLNKKFPKLLSLIQPSLHAAAIHLAFNISSSHCPSTCLHPTTLYGIKSNAVWLEQLVTKIYHLVESKTKQNSEQHVGFFFFRGSLWV